MPVESAAAKPELSVAAATPEPAAPTKIRPKEIVIELTAPVQAHGETIKKLTFRRPTGADVMALGDAYPIHINWQTGEVRPNPPVMGEIMTTLAQVPMSTIKQLEAEDFATCAYALMGFFPPGR
jgi:hypothetical protein